MRWSVKGVVSLGCRTTCDPAAYLITLISTILVLSLVSSSFFPTIILILILILSLLWLLTLRSIQSYLKIYSSGGDIADPYPHHS